MYEMDLGSHDSLLKNLSAAPNYSPRVRIEIASPRN
jgi:hypothetical protein